MNNPYNPITEPASYKWFEEKPKALNNIEYTKARTYTEQEQPKTNLPLAKERIYELNALKSRNSGDGDLNIPQWHLQAMEEYKDQELSLLTEKYNQLEAKTIDLDLREYELKRKYNKLKEAFEAQVAYTELLGDEIADMSTICRVHHWQSSRIEEGKSLREKLAELKVKAGLKEQ